MTDEEKRAKANAQSRARRAVRRATDPEYAEKVRARLRGCYRRLSPEQKARRNARKRELLAKRASRDPAFVAKRKAYREAYSAREDVKQRRAALQRARRAEKIKDPDYREHLKSQKRAWWAAKRAQNDPQWEDHQRATRAAWESANKEKVLAARREKWPEHSEKRGAARKVRFAGYSDARRMWMGARTRARERGLEFTIVQADVVVPEKCPILGVTLRRHKGRVGPSSPSLDRIDPTKGYVPGNVQVVSYRANMLKNDATISELEAVLAHLRLLRDRGVGFDESGNRT
jgi:hypothetical protein